MPATFSRSIVTDYLRHELGFRGVIVSDDLEMGAIGELCPAGEATVRAAGAGHDLLIICHTAARQREAHAALLDAYRTGALPRGELEASAARLEALQAKRVGRFEVPGAGDGAGALGLARLAADLGLGAGIDDLPRPVTIMMF